MTSSPGDFEIMIEPLSDRYDALDERWQNQTGQLYMSLKDEVGGVRKETSLIEGDKGGAEAIILALGSSGAFLAALEAFKAWLNRDRGRKLIVSYEQGGETKRVEVSGDGVGRDTFEEIVRAAAAHAGGERWVTGSTARS